MKRLLIFAALVLGLASCQREPEGLDINVGGEVATEITVSLPDMTTRAGGSNSATSDINAILADDAYTMRYMLQVFYGDKPSELYVRYSDNQSVSFPVRLVPGQDRDYNFVVWADIVEQVADLEDDVKCADLHYAIGADLREISVIDNKWVAMDETRDAFTAVKLVENYNGSQVINIPLYRPFAKLRVITTDMVELTKHDIIPTTAVVTYKTKHRVAYNALTGEAAAASATKEHSYTIAADAYGDNTETDRVLFTDYFFADDEVVKFEMLVKDQDDKEIVTRSFNTDINVKPNYLTTLKGNILTNGTDINVTVKPDMGGETGEIDGESFAKVDTVDELLDAINKGVENITLDGDIDLNDLLTAGTLSTRAGATLPIVIAEGKTLELDLNGFKISAPFESGSTERHYYAFDNKGTFTVKDSKGGGQIIARGNHNYGTMTLESGSIVACDGNGGYGVCNYENATFVMNGGSISTSLEDDHQVDKGGYDATTLRVDYGAKATINGGTINNICDFTVAIDNRGTTTIKGGTFTSVHTTIGNHSTMTIDGGSFTCNGLEGVTAHTLWTTVGTTTINGGTFDGKDNFNGFNVDAQQGAVVNINGGKFLPVHSGSLYGDGSIVVKGGEFFDDPSARVATGYKAVDNGNEIYTVVNLRAPEVEIFGLTLKPNGNNSKIVVKDKEGFLNITKLFNNWTTLFTDGNGTTYTNYANGAGADYYYSGKWTVSLEADIDLNNDTIPSVVIKHPVSAGSLAFEGNNHTIKNAKIVTDTATENEAGLFATLSNCGFKGLKLDNIHVTGSNVGNSTAGVLAGSNNVTIDNITITNSSVEGGKYTGGVVGYGYTDITNCSLTNVSVKGGYKQGGLIGYICATGANTGDVTGNTLTDCSVDGIGNGIYAGGKSEYIIGKLVGNYNCNGTCDDNVITNMTTSATSLIGKIEAGKSVAGQNSATASNTEDLKEALKDNTVSEVFVAEGTYTFPASDIKAGTTITCEEGTVFTGTSSLNIKGATVIGATFKNDNGIAVRETIHGNFKNCTFDASEALRWCYSTAGETSVFENCVVKTDFRGVHFDGLHGTVIFKNCEINGFNAFGGNGEVIFENCTMGCDQSSYNGLNLYLDTTIIGCKFIFLSGKTNFIDMEAAGKTLTIKNCTATLDGVAANVADYVGGSKKGDCTVTIE